MASVSDYEDKLRSILNLPQGSKNANLSFEWDTPGEAKAHLANIRLMQKELRLLKKDINATIKTIRLEYSEKKANIGSGLSLISRKRTFGKLNSIQKESLRKEELSKISPYQSLLRNIEGIIINMDKIKLKLQQ